MFSYEVKTGSTYEMETNIIYKIRKWQVLKFHGSDHLQIILHLNKIIECLKMTTFKRREKLQDINREYIKIQEWLLKQSYVQRNI
jgi:hypothetical protein